MFVLNRKLWFTSYVAIWVVLGVVYATDLPLWLSLTLSGLALFYVGFTDPAPRIRDDYRHGCGCRRCRKARGQHTRRATDNV